MQGPRPRMIAVFLCFACTPALAVEGPTAAGPIGGTDIRSAMLPPPGLYGGVILVGAGTLDFVDGDGDTIPALREAHLEKELAGPFLYYVPDIKVLGGSIGFAAIIPAGNQCGHLSLVTLTAALLAWATLMLKSIGPARSERRAPRNIPAPTRSSKG